MKFTLEIELGNEGMRTDVDIRDALHKTAYKTSMSSIPEAGDDGPVYDYNGKTVGKWEVKDHQLLNPAEHDIYNNLPKEPL